MSGTVRGVVFDLDGTLVDSMPLVYRAYAYALAPYRPAMTEAELSAHLGGPPEQILRSVLQDATAEAGALQRLNEFGAKNWQLVRPFPGVRELLEQLRASGCLTALWTGRDRASTELILAEHRLAALVDAGVCGDDLPSHKPDPQGLAEVLRRLALRPDEALFLGDHDVDVLGGAALGVKTVLISHGRIPPPTVQAQAWKTVAGPAEAYALARMAAAGNSGK